MFTKSQLKVLSSVSEGCDNPAKVSESTGISLTQVYRVVNDLRRIDLLEDSRTLTLKRTPMTSSLTKLLQSVPDVYMPLSSNGAEILAALDVPRTVPEICQRSGLELSRTYTKMRELHRRSMVAKQGHRYSVNERIWPMLVPFLNDYRRFLEINPEGVPVSATVYHRGKDSTLFYSMEPTKYEKTAFSVYGEYGIDILSEGSYCRTDEGEPTMDEVFLDSLYVISKTDDWRLKMFALIFYCKYRDRLKIPDLPVMNDMLDVLDGKRVKGWVPLWEMQERADMYGVELG